eukprot:11501150-Heterocapsa_arctica.AAC.1
MSKSNRSKISRSRSSRSSSSSSSTSIEAGAARPSNGSTTMRTSWRTRRSGWGSGQAARATLERPRRLHRQRET